MVALESAAMVSTDRYALHPLQSSLNLPFSETTTACSFTRLAPSFPRCCRRICASVPQHILQSRLCIAPSDRCTDALHPQTNANHAVSSASAFLRLTLRRGPQWLERRIGDRAARMSARLPCVLPVSPSRPPQPPRRASTARMGPEASVLPAHLRTLVVLPLPSPRCSPATVRTSGWTHAASSMGNERGRKERAVRAGAQRADSGGRVEYFQLVFARNSSRFVPLRCRSQSPPCSRLGSVRPPDGLGTRANQASSFEPVVVLARPPRCRCQPCSPVYQSTHSTYTLCGSHSLCLCPTASFHASLESTRVDAVWATRVTGPERGSLHAVVRLAFPAIRLPGSPAWSSAAASCRLPTSCPRRVRGITLRLQSCSRSHCQGVLQVAVAQLATPGPAIRRGSACTSGLSTDGDDRRLCSL